MVENPLDLLPEPTEAERKQIEESLNKPKKFNDIPVKDFMPKETLMEYQILTVLGYIQEDLGKHVKRMEGGSGLFEEQRQALKDAKVYVEKAYRELRNAGFSD